MKTDILAAITFILLGLCFFLPEAMSITGMKFFFTTYQIVFTGLYTVTFIFCTLTAFFLIKEAKSQD
jgi:hypothetical protein